MTDMKSRLHNNTITRKANRMLGLSIEHVNGAGILKQQIRTNLDGGGGGGGGWARETNYNNF